MGAVASVLGVGLSIFGAVQQGRSEKASREYQAQTARNNAVLAEQNARDATAAGQAEEQRRRMAASRQVGALRAGAGASGFDVGMGSVVDEFAAAEMIGESEALSIRNDFTRKAHAYRSQSADFAADAGAYQTAGRNAAASGWMKAGGALLSGAARVDPSWYGGGRSGGGGRSAGNKRSAASRWGV